jgi:cytochrome c peroxidase
MGRIVGGRTLLVSMGLCVITLAASREARAQSVGITEIAAGVGGNASAQFIEVRIQFSNPTEEHLWAQQPGEAASRAVLTFHDGAGNLTGEFAFTSNAPNTLNRFVLLGTQAFKDLTNQPDPDIIIPPLIRAGSGRVCFRSNPRNDNEVFSTSADCVAYGSFPAARNIETVGIAPNQFEIDFGAPVAAQLPTAGSSSIQRKESGDIVFGFGFASAQDNRTNFFLTTFPTPSRAGPELPADPAADIERGRQIFTQETFGGNGRTCATCHVLELNGGLPPANVKQRLGTLATSFDPLFIAERNMNLNTLTVSAAVGFAEGAVLTGTAGGAAARVKVRARLSSTRFLVHGGIDPLLTAGSAITDGSTTANVVSIVKGDLDGLEDVNRLRGPSVSPSFPDGRALILENIDGFELAPVFRKSPHLQNLKFTGPFGFNDDVHSLEEFSVQAVRQHFPRSLQRREGIDFRLPTPEEQRLLKVFMRSLDLLPGRSLAEQLDAFKLGHFARTAAQRRGRSLFENSDCTGCHGGATLAGGPRATGINAQPINGPAPGGDGLPMDSSPPGGTSNRPIATPTLFNVKNNAPFFHESSNLTLEDAVTFYTTDAFRNSPESENFGFNFTPQQVSDVAAFLRSLVFRDYAAFDGSVDVSREGSLVDFGARFPSAPRATRSITVRNTSASESVRFASPACRLEVTQGAANEFPAFDCGQLNGVTLTPGGQRTVSVSVDPATAGTKRALLELLTDEPTAVDIGARGITAEVDELFDFDPQDGSIPRFTRQQSDTAYFLFEGTLFQGTCFTCSGGPNGNILTHEFELPASFTLTVDALASPTDSPVDDFSIIFNFKDVNNYYYASFNERDGSATSDDVNTNGIFKVVNGARSQIRDFSLTTAPGDETVPMHKIRVEKVRGTIKVFRGTTLMGLVTDTTFTGGKAGVGSFNNDARFDNFMVRAHRLGEDFTATPSPLLPILGGTFGLSGGKLRLTNASTNSSLPNANIAVHPTALPAGDFELFVEGNADGATGGNDDFTVVFEYQNATNYMFVNFGDVNDSAGNGVFRVVNSVRTQIRDFSGLTTPGTARRISVRRTGATIRVMRDGAQIGTDVNDNTFSGGQVGVGSRDNAASFDNLFVEKH